MSSGLEWGKKSARGAVVPGGTLREIHEKEIGPLKTVTPEVRESPSIHRG